MPPSGISKFYRYGDRFEPKCGLEPKLEALPQFDQSPSSPRGVMAKAITPPPQQVNLLIPEEYFIGVNDWLLSSAVVNETSSERKVQYLRPNKKTPELFSDVFGVSSTWTVDIIRTSL